MIDIIQVYKAHDYIRKPQYTTTCRKAFHCFAKQVHSQKGYLQDNTLYLPNYLQKELSPLIAKAIILTDWKSVSQWPSGFLQIQNCTKPVLVTQVNAIIDFDIFKLKFDTESQLDITLNYHAHAFSIGEPSRNNHKIYSLKPGNSIRYRINGKSDFTMSGRKERTYAEYDYIFEWLGRADCIEFVTEDKISFTKSIEVENIKIIDERKILK